MKKKKDLGQNGPNSPNKPRLAKIYPQQRFIPNLQFYTTYKLYIIYFIQTFEWIVCVYIFRKIIF